MKKKSLLAKFLISYALIVSLPIVLVLLYYYPYSTSVVKEKASDWNYHVTEQLMNSMNIFTKYVYNLPAELLQNRQIKPYMADEDPYQKITIANEMKKYNITDAFIENTLLYLNSIDYFFTKTGSAYILSDFQKKGVGYVYPNWTVEQIYTELNNITTPTVRPVEPVYVPGGHKVNLMSFAMPLPLGGNHSPGAVLILVRESTILNMMQASNDKYNGTFIILDEKQRCLVSTTTCDSTIQSEINGLLSENMDQLPQEVVLGGESFLLAHTVSEMNHWHYIRLLPVSDTIADIRYIQINTVLILFAILMLTTLIIYFSLRFNYHPIKRLVEFSANIFDADSKSSYNEIETIHHALNQLSATKDKLYEEVNQTRPKLRDHILFELMIGNYDDWESFQLDAHAYSISFPHHTFAVAIISIEAESSIDTAIHTIKHHFKGSSEQITAFVIKSLYNNEILLLLSYEQSINTQSYLVQIQQQIEQKEDKKSLVGVSLPMQVDSIKSFHIAYLQASRCLEQLRFQRNATIAIYNDQAQQSIKGIVSYQTELMQSLELSILKSDIERIKELTLHIQTFMSGEGAPAHIVRAVYLNTMSILFNYLERFQKENDHSLHHIDFIFQHRYSLDQMLSIMNDATSKLIELLTLTSPTNRKATMETIQALIETYWSDANLSLQMMADHFDMSPSNFSYHFKKIMGQNFKEYIDNYRIQQSLQLLKSTQASIEQIALQVGYMNSSSFIRSFKKIVGMTPGQYREHLN